MENETLLLKVLLSVYLLSLGLLNTASVIKMVLPHYTQTYGCFVLLASLLVAQKRTFLDRKPQGLVPL